MYGRPIGCKKNLSERFERVSRVLTCIRPVNAAINMLLARMGIRRSGPIQNRVLLALRRNLVFLISSHRLLRHNFPFDLLTPATTTGSLRFHTATTGAR